MSTAPVINYFDTLPELVNRFRADLTVQRFLLLYAYNGIGKTRLSMAFKDKGKEGDDDSRDTLYFNAYTEDLFYWDNDLESDVERRLMINSSSNFFNGFRELALEEKIFAYLERYATFDYRINYEDWFISFNKGQETNIKISRGEETIFKWCVFLAICELAIDGAEGYNWVKYLYIDDPISSLDDNNAISVACDLAELLKRSGGRIKAIISSHHILFYNVLCNELKSESHRKYFLHKDSNEKFSLRKTTDTPFFHHVASLSELNQIRASRNFKTFHFNLLRSIMEKTASFFGYDKFRRCIHGIEDEVLYNRALNLLSHGKYSIYEPVDMSDDTKNLFIQILDGFLRKYEFDLPNILSEAAGPIAEIASPDEVTITPAGEVEAINEEPTSPVGEVVAQAAEQSTPPREVVTPYEESSNQIIHPQNDIPQ